ncbi:hypothetical protein WKR88_23195 [Trinickia caryophylli]|uniref:Uncharacterized protein n=2 Tax=Trinickia caryophylli TaxID=28094 RepID=A0A1X7GNX0_TRICW|nr:hypothetical protein [Trinickia caryophylli]PMS10482.1 hypothetical protein C0Z17_19105 [Trinickia caryophylli]TRX19125.1 hypothetical protein FNF07_13365 [Trinickia caryophylli]WQE13579.1 hypothetical protein U0034_09565 [Trinickia caryophylli]SMF72553.1 hypothetical protein SAMN06295900_11716 [Trinickia caryophylli]
MRTTHTACLRCGAPVSGAWRHCARCGLRLLPPRRPAGPLDDTGPDEPGDRIDDHPGPPVPMEQPPLRERIVGQLPRRWSAADANGARRWSLPAGLALTLLGFALAFGAYVIGEDERDAAPAQVERHAQEPYEADSHRSRTLAVREPPLSELSSLSPQGMLALIQAQIDGVRAENAEDAARASQRRHGRPARIAEDGERSASPPPPSSGPDSAETRRKSTRVPTQAATRRHGTRAGTAANAAADASPAPSAAPQTGLLPSAPAPSPGAGTLAPAASPAHPGPDAPRDGSAALAPAPAPPLLAAPTGAETSRLSPTTAPPSPHVAGELAPGGVTPGGAAPSEAMPGESKPDESTPGESAPGESSASGKPKNLAWAGTVRRERAIPARTMAHVSAQSSHKTRRGAKPRGAERAVATAPRDRLAALRAAPRPPLAWPFEIPAEPHRRQLDLTQAQSALYRGH